MRAVRIAKLRRYKAINGSADGFGACTAEHILGGGIEQHDALAIIDGDDRVHRRSDDARKANLAFL
jgi:hypothetical protein